MSQAVLGRPIAIGDDRLGEILSPEYFVRIRTTPGGPAPAQIDGAIAESRTRLDADERWIRETERGLRQSEAALEAAIAAL